jgi:hypothetical protein
MAAIESGASVRVALKSQYLAAMSQLAAAIRQCPEGLWTGGEWRFPYWHVAYHVLFYTHLYTAADRESFTPWSGHRPDYQYQEKTPRPPYTLPQHSPYTKDELLAYAGELPDVLCRSADEARFDDPSGFEWLRMNKLELHLYNLRHLEHHTAQLVDRLRNSAGIAVEWTGMGPRG